MTKEYTIWIDVEDIFRYFENNTRPSGIQRLVFEILSVIRQQADAKPDIGRIVLTRRNTGAIPETGPLLSPVSFDALNTLFSSHTDEATPTHTEGRSAAHAPSHSLMRRLRHAIIRRIESLPPELARPLLNLAVNQLRALQLLRRYARTTFQRATPSRPTAPAPLAPTPSAAP
ncbi:MAG: glycosyltransferase family 1 protein, partial [Gluconobacter oxydans]